jgi:hypothetical protein
MGVVQTSLAVAIRGLHAQPAALATPHGGHCQAEAYIPLRRVCMCRTLGIWQEMHAWDRLMREASRRDLPLPATRCVGSPLCDSALLSKKISPVLASLPT